MKRQYFGTDGVRGPYGGPLINEDFAWRLGAAAGRWLKAARTVTGGRIFLGRDTRASGASLLRAVAGGLTAEGFQAVSLGVVPTPAVSLAVRDERAALGVVITASHNPAGDNGIKFFGPAGRKLTDEDERRIEQLLPDQAGAPAPGNLPTWAAARAYESKVSAILPMYSIQGWKIVLDTANGATCVTSPVVLEHIGASLTLVGNSPDGANINAGVGSEHPEKMSAVVRHHGAVLGIAHDGDGDRCVLCDEHGAVLDGDEILTILALHALRLGKLARKTLVVTVQSNLGVDAAVTAAGGRVCRTPVGDRYVIERMLAEGAELGGESSGHVIWASVSPTGDGLVAAMKVIEVMLATGKPLSELRRALVKFPQLSVALQVPEKKPLESLQALPAAIRAVEAELGDRGRVLVRYSGTESKLRLLVEGPTDAVVQAAMQKLQAAARGELGIL
ncbi:MAG: phosphoglucosamine mutase [bacterium]|nr:phosphoglucosamine mutase [bacterium]MDI1337859.1 phosphoglucosamine mutase [Lacunisphaera sp.]